MIVDWFSPGVVDVGHFLEVFLKRVIALRCVADSRPSLILLVLLWCFPFFYLSTVQKGALHITSDGVEGRTDRLVGHRGLQLGG